MRLTATLLPLLLCFLVSNISFAQQTLAYNTTNTDNNAWIEENASEAGRAIRFSVDVLSDAVELFWEVSSEQAIEGYELQRSIDGENFEKIEWMNAVGGKELGGTYLHLDQAHLNAQILQYRVKAVRNDGQYVFSSIQNIDIQLSRPMISLSNDVQPRYIALDDEGLDENQKIELLDTAGKTLLRLDPNTAALNIDFSDLEQGVYYIKMVLSDGEDRIARVVKQI